MQKKVKNIEYIQDEKNYNIELSTNSDNISFCIKDISKVDFFYELEMSFTDVQKKNKVFLMYQTSEEFINMVDNLINNKNIKIIENKETFQLNIYVFNVLNGNKEEVSFLLQKKENRNKDEIIKHLCIKVDNLEEKLKEVNKKYDEVNKKYDEMNKKYDDLKKVVDELIKKPNYHFVWTNHSNCQLSNGGKIIKKVQNEGWNTGIKGNQLLKRNEINTFKIKVNHVNRDKSGLEFGISKYSSNIGFGTDWNLSCAGTSCYKYNNFKNEIINEGDIVTFIADLKAGTLEVKKNDISLGILNGLPTNEDLVPSASIYFVNDEIEIID